MASIIPKYCHVPTRFAFNVWIELSRHLLGTRANFDARYAVNWSQSHGAGLKPYPLLFLSTNFWIWWRDNDVKSFLNVPPIRLRWDFRNVGSSSDRVCWVWLIWCRVWVEFRLSSVRFGSVSVTIFGFWFSCQPLLNLMARQRREVISKCSTHQTQVRLFTKGERRGSRGLGVVL